MSGRLRVPTGIMASNAPQVDCLDASAPEVRAIIGRNMIPTGAPELGGWPA